MVNFDVFFASLSVNTPAEVCGCFFFERSPTQSTQESDDDDDDDHDCDRRFTTNLTYS